MTKQQTIDPIKFHGIMLDLSSQTPTVVNITEGKPGDENKPTIIYDLDGTIANELHRRHFVEPKEGEKKDFPAYYRGIPSDTPHWAVIEQLVKDHAGGANIVIITGRPDTYLMPTLQQLYIFQIAEYVSYMIMRPTECFIPAAEFKQNAIGMMVSEGAIVAGIYDDSAKVREMAKGLGLEAFDPDDLINKVKLILPPGV